MSNSRERPLLLKGKVAGHTGLFSPDGSIVLLGKRDENSKEIQRWNAKTGEQVGKPLVGLGQALAYSLMAIIF
jgi:hypothetical protein